MQAAEIINNRSRSPIFEDGIKLTSEVKIYLWKLIRSDPTVPRLSSTRSKNMHWRQSSEEDIRVPH